METFELTLRTPEGELYGNTVKSVTLTTEIGQMQILANHASLTGSFLFSPIIIEEKGKEENFIARNGIIMFNNGENSALILALYCEKRSEVSHQTAKEYLAFIEEQLKKGEHLSEIQILYLEGEKLAVEEQVKSQKI